MARISGLSGDDETPVFVISVAAELAGMHAQTLRQYDRMGLVIPSRTRGGGRRYSAADVTRLREVQRLSQEEGINLSGIKRILELQEEVSALSEQLEKVTEALEALAPADRRRVFAADRTGEISALRRGQRPQRPTGGALVLWRPGRRD